MREKLVLGLSGGVDSAVAARLLREKYDVTCLWLDIGLGGGEDAAAVAKELGLPFETADIRDALEERVCTPFAQTYLAGKTPLPTAWARPMWPRATMPAVAQGRTDGPCCGRDGPPTISPICSPACHRTSCAGWSFPWGSMRSGRSAPWPGRPPWPWRRSPTPWRSASSRTETMPPGWTAGETRRPPATLWHPPLYPGPAAGPGGVGPPPVFCLGHPAGDQ